MSNQLLKTRIRTCGGVREGNEPGAASTPPDNACACAGSFLRGAIRAKGGHVIARKRKQHKGLCAKLLAQDPRCYYCRRRIGRNQQATLDHIIPRSKCKRPDSEKNLVLCCQRCNEHKGNLTPRKWILPLVKAYLRLIREGRERGQCSPEDLRMLTIIDQELSETPAKTAPRLYSLGTIAANGTIDPISDPLPQWEAMELLSRSGPTSVLIPAGPGKAVPR